MFKANASVDQKRPSVLLSAAIFIVCTALMAYLRLHLYKHQFVTLTYGLPLLLCLWHRDRLLLWGMAATFTLMSVGKALHLLGDAPGALDVFVQWVMQVVNIAVIGATVHIILNKSALIRRRNAELLDANLELEARQQEISRQNEELQTQAEELAQQNEELQQQSEKLAQQNEEMEHQSAELQAQGEELQSANLEIQRRESMLQSVLTSLSQDLEETQLLDRICQTLLQLLGEAGVAATVLEKVDQELISLCHAGCPCTTTRWPVANSFASLVMEHNKTAFIDDLAARPDIAVVLGEKICFRSVIATPLRLAGQPIGVVSVYSDSPRQWTTDQFRVIEWIAVQCSLAIQTLRLQASLRQARDELASANSKLEKQVQQRTTDLQEMVSELEHFSYTITHDMRAPLRAMRGFAEMLQELCGDAIEPDKKDCLNRIITSASRMDCLITDALSYSQAVKQQLTLSPVDTAHLLNGIIESYPTFQPPHARVEIRGELPKVLANEAGLTQCFSNLMNNAVKFVEPGKVPVLNIWAEKNNGFVRLWFQDNGIGIPKSAHERIFHMFQRATKAYEGTGIGLALVRKVSERMSGRVGVESEPGQGSRFWIELPVAN